MLGVAAVGIQYAAKREANMTPDDVSEEDLNESDSDQDALVDEVEEESFPASDPPSSWAGSNPDSAR
jgi:hypothetical protein